MTRFAARRAPTHAMQIISRLKAARQVGATAWDTSLVAVERPREPMPSSSVAIAADRALRDVGGRAGTRSGGPARGRRADGVGNRVGVARLGRLRCGRIG